MERYFFCNSCSTQTSRVPIAILADFSHRQFWNGEYTGACIFGNLFNVVTEDNRNTDRVLWIRCIRCNELLGNQYIQILFASLRRIGTFSLNMAMVDHWNGNQRVAGDVRLLEFDDAPRPAVPRLTRPRFPRPREQIISWQMGIPPKSKYFCCKNCSTTDRKHIATLQHYVSHHHINGVYSGHCIFKYLCNVKIRSDPNVDNLNWVVCIKCDALLGWQYIRVSAAEVHLCGRFNLNMAMVEFWTGHRQIAADVGLLENGYVPIEVSDDEETAGQSGSDSDSDESGSDSDGDDIYNLYVPRITSIEELFQE